MANLKEVRIRISSVQSTQQITKAMKMVSAAKLKRATNAIVQLRPYATKLKEILGNLSASLEGSSSPYIQEREPNKVLVVVVSSNRGLAGAFNLNVIKTANNLIAEKYSEQLKNGNVSIVAVGKKAQDFYEKRNYNVVGNNNDVYMALNFDNVSKITDAIMEGFAKGDFDRVELVYNRFKNAAVQISIFLNPITPVAPPLPPVQRPPPPSPRRRIRPRRGRRRGRRRCWPRPPGGAGRTSRARPGAARSR